MAWFDFTKALAEARPQLEKAVAEFEKMVALQQQLANGIINLAGELATTRREIAELRQLVMSAIPADAPIVIIERESVNGRDDH